MRRYGLVDIPTEAADIDAVPISRTITINSVTYDLSENRSWIVSAGSTSGGSSVNYYLNGSVAASVATYKQMSFTAIIGTGTDFTLTGNGLISQFLTDIGNPNRVLIPGGAWNFEMFFSSSSSGGNPKFYVELHKYNGSTFTLIASTTSIPEAITGGTSIDLYLTSLAVPETVLAITDRLAIRVYIVDNSGGRTITLHTENSHLCEIITSFAGGVTSLNALTANTQYLVTGTSGTDFNIVSLVDTHTFNIPTASASNRGALSSADWTTFNSKESALTFSSPLVRTVNAISIPVATTSVNGYLSSTDWTTFNNKQATITLTTTGTSGAATFSANTLNIPDYSAADYLPLAGGTMTGQIVLSLSSSSSDVTKGIRFPNDPFGGGGDIAGMRLYEADFGSAEDQCLELYVGNDDGLVGFDKINFKAPTNNNVTINGFPILNSGNFASPIQDGIISGGVVSYSGSGLLFNVSACSYIISGITYNTAATTITLTTANPTNPRIDVIAVDTSSAVVLITGTAAVNPVEPQVNPLTQIQLTNITVAAGATTPSISNALIYDENAATPAEWFRSNTGFATVNYANTVAPYWLTKSIAATCAINSIGGLNFLPTTTVDLRNYTTFKFAIKLSRALNGWERIYIQFRSGISSYIGGTIYFFGPNWNTPARYGFSNTSTAWQLITISLAEIGATSSTVYALDFICETNTTATALILNLDRIELQGINNQIPTGSLKIGDKVTSGTTGSVLFVGANSILQQDNANFFWNDSNNRLGIGTATPSAILHSVGSVTAASAIARGNYMQPTLVAAANSDVLVGLDIQPTFTNGAFTGVSNLGLRIGSLFNIDVANQSLNILNDSSGGTRGINIYQNNTGVQAGAAAFYKSRGTNASPTAVASGDLIGAFVFKPYISTTYASDRSLFGASMTSTTGISQFFITGTTSNNYTPSLLIAENGNVTVGNLGSGTIITSLTLPTSKLQVAGNAAIGYTTATAAPTNGLTISGSTLIGTTTDAGYKLDVNGTARVSGALTVTGSASVTGGIGSGTSISVGTSAGTSSWGVFSQASRSALYLGSMQGANAPAAHLVFGADSLGTPFVFKGGVTSTLTGGTEYFRISISGISVNNTNPFFDTNFKGLNIGAGTSGSQIQLCKSDGTRIGTILAESATNALSIYTPFNGPLALGANSQTNYYNFATSGNIQIKNGGTFTDVSSAIFSVTSTTKGFLPPRMTTTEKNAIGTPAQGLMVFDTTLVKLCVYSGTTWETITSI